MHRCQLRCDACDPLWYIIIVYLSLSVGKKLLCSLSWPKGLRKDTCFSWQLSILSLSVDSWLLWGLEVNFGWGQCWSQHGFIHVDDYFWSQCFDHTGAMLFSIVCAEYANWCRKNSFLTYRNVYTKYKILWNSSTLP